MPATYLPRPHARPRLRWKPGAAALLIAATSLAASGASAQTTQTGSGPQVDVSLGFGGIFKPETWVPVYVRVADDAPRPATLEILTARGRLGHAIQTRVFTSAQPTTFTLYAPVGSLDRVSLQLRDGRDRLLSVLDLSDQAQRSPAALGGPAFGVAGSTAVAQRVVNQLVLDSGEYIAAGAIETRLLPERSVGYGCLDVLVLPELDTDTLDDAVEAAIVQWARSGGIVVAWHGPQAATADSPLRDALPPGGRLATDAVLQRALGLGQVVLCGFDPTRGSARAPADRLGLWRRLTAGQVALTPDERRAGVFDPLVPQAVAEQQFTSVRARSSLRWLLLAGMLLGAIAGPGEIILLLACRRHPRTWYTLGGLGLLVASGSVWLVAADEPLHAALPLVEIVIEADDGVIETSALASAPAPGAAVQWLTGERLDASRQPAAELRLGQRMAGFEPLPPDPLIAVGQTSPRVRSRTDSPPGSATGQSLALTGERTVRNLRPDHVEAVVIALPDAVTSSRAALPAGADAVLDAVAVPSDDPNTRRVETGIERLGAMAGWEPLLLDRQLSERLVRLQETERATIIAARLGGEQARYVLRVVRQGHQ